MHASVSRKPEARPTTAAPPAFAGSFDLPTRQSGALRPSILNPRTVADCGEHALIARIKERLTTPPWVVVGPGDDAAAIEPVRGALEVVTTDAQVEGVHFDRRFVPPDAIGHRALAVNLSDLAAMGARPRAALLSMALPSSLEIEAFDQHRRRLAVAGNSLRRRADRRQHHAHDRAAAARRHGHRHRAPPQGADPCRARKSATRSTSRARWVTQRSGCGGFRMRMDGGRRGSGAQATSGPIPGCAPGSCSAGTARPPVAWTSAMDWQTVCVRSHRLPSSVLRSTAPLYRSQPRHGTG